MPECSWGRHTRWLTTLTIDADEFGATREDLRLALEAAHTESRPVWKPMHVQPPYAQYESIGGEVAERLFRDGLCLPSGSQLTREELGRSGPASARERMPWTGMMSGSGARTFHSLRWGNSQFLLPGVSERTLGKEQIRVVANPISVRCT